MAKRTTKKADTPAKQLLRRVAIAVGIVAVGVFLVEGGEWGTFDLMKQRTRFDKLQGEVRQLERDVDSLRAEHKSITTDKARLERIAREQYGMVRGGKELLYRVIDDSDADSTRVDSTKAPRG